jgi:FkbM family methyltransferase
MRLMQFIGLRRVVPKTLRSRLRGQWDRLLRFEQYLQERRFYRDFVKPGDLVFDIGANKGDKTAALLSLGARVVAVEPNPVCISVIVKNHRRAIESGRLHVECAAVASQPGHITLAIFDSTADMVSGSPEFLNYARTVGYSETRTIAALALTVDQLIERFGLPQFLKIDVEGMDAEVLRGLSLKPQLLSFEYNVAAALWEHTRECFGQAERLGFTEANLTEATSSAFLFGSWVSLRAAFSQVEQWRRLDDRVRWGDVVVR